MSAKLVKKKGYTVEFEMSVPADKFEAAMQKSYIKNVKKINIPGFRKGKAPRKYIEKIYSEAIFYDDAINFAFPESYTDAVKELDLKPVDRPDVDIKEIGGGKDLVLTVKVDVEPEVKISSYEGIEVEEKKYPVAKADVDAEIERLRDRNSRMITVEDRPVQKGDIAVIDFEGFVDGKAFDGGKAENHELEIGSGAFIPGFEDQIIGAETGSEIEVNVKFPKDYQAEELKGKDATFKVKVNQIKFKELPELDDEFAKDVSEFDTLKELTADIKKKFTERNKNRAKAEMENDLVETLVKGLKADIPNGMIESRTESLIKDFEMRLYQQGMNIDMYKKYTGMTDEDLKTQFKPQAENAVKSTLALEKVAELEKVKVTDKELEKKLEEMAKSYNMELSKIKEILREEDIENVKKDLVIEKTLDLLLSKATLVEKKAEAKPAAKKTTTAKKTETAKKETGAKTTAKKTTATTAKKTETAKKTTTKKTTTTKKVTTKKEDK